ncbi:MAG: peptide chain release factor 3 [Spirochaetia bacterium]|nr:peptide chain release factor 3 [Spirochaetia bacterium]
MDPGVIQKRRTFAIIAHPDAGKTTLTEKLLLYGGAIHLAGQVRAKRDKRGTRSDWMKLEQERGISINTSVMQFSYADYVLNLLDTPGHEDFSEDTYRTLMAVECAIMILDGARGVEPRTIKLFEICKERKIPIITFINKMDLPAMEPFELMDNIETVLGITCVPFLWPMGSGSLFKGVYNLRENTLHRFEKTKAGAYRVPEKISGLNDPDLQEMMGERDYSKFLEDVHMAKEMLPDFDEDLFRATEITPVLFGSAGTNFGIELLLNEFLKLAPPPQKVTIDDGSVIDPGDENFRAFVFKLQANMNKAHRDRVAFVRILSGVFERGMQVYVPRLEKNVKLASPVSFFGQERNTIDFAYPGDVIGLINPRLYQIGDILCNGSPIKYSPLPVFAPEAFASLVLSDTSKSKAFRKGISELAEEGVVQVFNADQQSPIIGGIGQLQFDVFKYRLEDEYNAPCRVENLNFECSRWLKNESDIPKLSRFDRVVRDHHGNAVVLFETRYRLQGFMADNPDIQLLNHPPV